MLAVFGAHSNVAGNLDVPKNSFMGHAWLSLHYSNGNTATVGLWPTSSGLMRKLVRDSRGFFEGSAEYFDVEWNKERDEKYAAVASRYYGLFGEQSARDFVKIIGEFQGWRVSNNCATWVTRVVGKATREVLKSEIALGYSNTPRMLGNAIIAAETKQSTNLKSPMYVR